MRHRPLGWLCVEGSDGRVEMTTIMCGHCNRHYAIKPKQRAEDIGGSCYACGSLLCPRCSLNQKLAQPCRPFERWLDEHEKAHATAEALDARAKVKEERMRKLIDSIVTAEAASYHARRSYGF